MLRFVPPDSLAARSHWLMFANVFSFFHHQLLATVSIFSVCLLVRSTQVQSPFGSDLAQWRSSAVAPWSEAINFGRLMFSTITETSPNLLNLFLCRLDHVIIHVGALSLPESQELVCIWCFLFTMCVIHINQMYFKMLSVLSFIGKTCSSPRC